MTAEGKLVNVKEAVKEDKLPKAVTEALRQKYPGAKIVEAEKVTTGEGEKAKTVYELAIETDKGNRDVIIDPDGKIAGEPK